MKSVEQYKVFSVELEGTAEGNPYVDVTFGARFERADGGDAVDVPGFYKGDGTYRVNFMPGSAGAWNYTTHSSDSALNGVQGSFEVTPASGDNHGRVLRARDVLPREAPFSTENDFTFAYEDGTRYLPFGTTCYAWTNQDEELQEQTLETLSHAPFNKIRMCIFPKFYDYNVEDPAMYAFEGSKGAFDHTKFYEPFWENLEKRIAQLDELGIQADIILLHPYDKPEDWGFSRMTKDEDVFYLTYAVRRLAAYKNVWWSLANEWDLLPWKPAEDWDLYARIVMANDPYGHLRSIHNCREIFDHSHPWITHVSWQRCDLQRTAECVVDLRAQYGKPVIVDEAGYEGNINWGWGNLTAEEEVRRFWEGCLRGGYVTHGETFVDRGPKLWWAHGGKLYGDSPERIAFCRSYMELLPSGMDWVPDEIGVIDGTFTWDVTCMADSVGKGSDDVLMYFGFFRPAYREFTGDEGKRYQVDVIDTWNMTVETLPQTFEGAFRIDLPSRQYMMLRVRTVKAE